MCRNEVDMRNSVIPAQKRKTRMLWKKGKRSLCRRLKLVTKLVERQNNHPMKGIQMVSKHLKMISVVVHSLLIIASTGCTDSTENHLNVVNGKKTLSYPAVIQLTDGVSNCTGTFVRPNVFLTAGHCPNGLPSTVVQLRTSSSRTVIHPGYPKDGSKDVALVFFDEDVSDQVLPLQFHQPTIGDKVTLIGYGNTRYTEGSKSTGSDGAKRIGTNTISNIDSGYIEIIGVPGGDVADSNAPIGQMSSLASGDSGGPLLNESGEIIGVNANIRRTEDNNVLSKVVMLSDVKDFIEA